VIGARAGSAAGTLARDGWTVRAVEEDPAIAEAVRRDFGSSPLAVQIDATEPGAFLRRSDSAWDLIVVDAFGETSPPAQLATREFFALVASRLAPGGVVALAVESRGWEDILVRSLASTLRTSFTSVVALPTSEPPDRLGSVVLLAADRALDFPEEKLPNPKDVLGDDYMHWVVVQMNHAWLTRFEPRADGAQVLSEDRSPIDLWFDRTNVASRQELHAFFGPWGHSW
jgi:spermidine synthase